MVSLWLRCADVQLIKAEASWVSLVSRATHPLATLLILPSSVFVWLNVLAITDCPALFFYHRHILTWSLE